MTATVVILPCSYTCTSSFFDTACHPSQIEHDLCLFFLLEAFCSPVQDVKEGDDQPRGKEQHEVQGSKTYLLKFNMHCQCNGCVKKISEGVKEISLSEGVERADLSVETGEVEVTGRMDAEKLCCVLHEATKKCVTIVGQSIPVGETKNLFGQAAAATSPPEARDRSSAWWNRRGRTAFHVVAPSAPPLPEEYEDDDAWRSKAVASERCWYRWSTPSSTPGVWAASDVTGTLAMYEL